MGRGIQRHLPCVAQGFGFPLLLELHDHGQGITTATNTLDQFTVQHLLPEHRGTMLAIRCIEFQLVDLGSGASSGNWTLRVVKNGVTTTPVATASFVYNATTLLATVDLRTGPDGPGYLLAKNDVLRLDVSAVAAGTLSGGLKGIRARILAEDYGISV